MQVTIRHRQEAAGVAGDKRRFYVDCQVLFSEEEKAIIAHRGLAERVITVPPAFPQGSGLDPDSLKSLFLKYGSRACLGIGLLLVVIGITAPEARVWAAFWILGGSGIFIFRKAAEARNETSYQEQQISLRRLLANPLITACAGDLSEAEACEAQIREALVSLKGFLASNTAVKEPVRFEL